MKKTLAIKRTTIICGLCVLVISYLFLPCYSFGQEEVADTTVAIAVPEEESEEVAEMVNYFLPVDFFASDSATVVARRLSSSDMRAYQNDDAFWYANYDFNKEEEKKVSGSTFNSKGFRNMMWVIIIACFVAVIFWYLAQNNVGFFRRKDTAINGGDEMPEETDDIFSINYGLQIEKAATAGNFRLAIRFMFLRLLRDLSEKNIIQYKQGRTNFDYLVQLHPTVYYRHFFRLVRNYEYAWYGKAQINPEIYSQVKNEFDGFNSSYIIK